MKKGADFSRARGRGSRVRADEYGEVSCVVMPIWMTRMGFLAFEVEVSFGWRHREVYDD